MSELGFGQGDLNELNTLIQTARKSDPTPEALRVIEIASATGESIRELFHEEALASSKLATIQAERDRRAQWLFSLESVRGELAEDARAIAKEVRRGLNEGSLTDEHAARLIRVGALVQAADDQGRLAEATQDELDEVPVERERLHRGLADTRLRHQAKTEDVERRERLLEDDAKSASKSLRAAEEWLATVQAKERTYIRGVSRILHDWSQSLPRDELVERAYALIEAGLSRSMLEDVIGPLEYADSWDER